MTEKEAIKMVLDSIPSHHQELIEKSWALKANPSRLSLGPGREGWIVGLAFKLAFDPSVCHFEVYEPDGKVIKISTL
jgi:hypothetical protein